MRIADVLRSKGAGTGAAVRSVPEDVTVRQVLARLAEHEIGALVVLAEPGPPGQNTDATDATDSTAELVDAAALRGIVSERDVVRRLHRRGEQMLDEPVGTIMTTDVVVCAPDDDLDRIAETMTARRIRHMPVVDGGRLVGLVSIGDVVKARIEQLEHDRGQLEAYITG